MITSAIACLALGKMTQVRAPFIDKIEVTITTGEDDLRSDSNCSLFLQYSHGHHQVQPMRSETLGSGSQKVLTITPNLPNLTVADLQQIRVMFGSGKSTGFDDHWSLQGVKVTASIAGATVPVYSNQRLGMHLMYSQTWTSPFFPKADVPDVINPSEVFGVIEGGDAPPNNARIWMDMETEDGLSWRGMVTGNGFNRSGGGPNGGGARVESTTNQHVAVKDIRALRIKCEGTDWHIRGMRFQYRDPQGQIRDLVSYNEVNADVSGLWWEPTILKPLKRLAGVPVHGMIVEVMTGRDDLRRKDFGNASDNQRFNSKIDLKIGSPFLSSPRYPNWLMNADYVRHSISGRQPIVLQDGDEFPQGWTGRFSSNETFKKIFMNAGGDPYFLSSDFTNATLTFKQGQGGNLLGGDRASDGIINGLLGADQWDFQGLVISIVPPTGPIRRIYSNFAINQRMNGDGQTWKSRNFDTLLLRARPTS